MLSESGLVGVMSTTTMVLSFSLWHLMTGLRVTKHDCTCLRTGKDWPAVIAAWTVSYSWLWRVWFVGFREPATCRVRSARTPETGGRGRGCQLCINRHLEYWNTFSVAKQILCRFDLSQSSYMTLWPMMMHHHTKFGYKRFSSWGDLDLDHNRAIQSFHKTIQIMMMCHQTTFSCKRISSSEDIVETVIFWSHEPWL